MPARTGYEPVMKQNNLNKVLIIRLSSIGDIVLTSPVIRCLKTQSPETEIHFLTKHQYRSVLVSNPHISRIWTYDNDFKELLPQLRREDFSFITDLHRNIRSRFVILKLGKPSASFPKLNFRKWLLVNTRINALPGLHVVDRYFKALKKLGIHNDGNGLDYFIPPGEEVDPSMILKGRAGDYIAFSIGGRHNTKIFPEDKIVSVCRSLDSFVVLLGGQEDSERGERIVNQCPGNVYNGCGKFSIGQSASLIRQSAHVITNDTGLMHIAAAFRKPVISIWGNTVPDFGMYPYLPEAYSRNSVIMEVKGLSCRPCSKLGFERCPKHHFRCMNDQDADMVVKNLKKEY